MLKKIIQSIEIKITISSATFDPCLLVKEGNSENYITINSINPT